MTGSTKDAADPFDVFVIGGGVNGCGVARDAVGRGYSVCLAEARDLASGASSAATKLIHGGLRYLEYREFRLVREALKEREVLWSNAPHIIWPLRFVLPHHEGLRPAWLLRLGLFLYDHLGGRELLPATRVVDMRTDPVGAPLRPLFSKGFEYSDCWVDDARLVVLNAVDAAERGATVKTRSPVRQARREGGLWRIELESPRSRGTETVSARFLVNAAGPWVGGVLSRAMGDNDARDVRLVQGSHIVVPKLYDHDRCYIFQNTDGRIVFAIPYERDYTLIGTTDRDYRGDPGDVTISREEIDYLREAVSEYFEPPLNTDRISWTFSGVRPLFDDGSTEAQAATRDYALREEGGDAAAGVTILGGKITTYRRLAEAVLERIESGLGKRGAPWTADAPLPGGDFPVEGYGNLVADLRTEYPFIERTNAERLARLYGTRSRSLLADSKSVDDLGRHFGAGLYEAEVRYLIEREWAVTADDVIWRRSKLGLRLGEDERDALELFMRSTVESPPAATA